ncbi:MAG: glutamate--tRNA ligase [Candidatus Izemoplasmatales bacterium]|jgi:glutamyl-tRNA synthetase
MISQKELAQLIFPDVDLTIVDLEQRFPQRILPKGAMVTRFAPSPTGFLHTGSLFASLISWRFAKQSQGVFFVRLEDTDQKREIQGSKEQLLDELGVFGIIPDESFTQGGDYGSYIQSERKWIYDIVIKHLIEQGLAYPCFCTHEELDEIRKEQERIKANPGYYGEYAKCRNRSPQIVFDAIRSGKPYVIRFKSPGEETRRVSVIDAIRGEISFPENVQDIVIMKSDGLPTYHFAHLVDDHFMRPTHITRGEEWMASLPVHLQLFESIGWTHPVYAHLPVIMKLEDGKRRKLSKRKDPEASVSYFLEQGYPIEGFLEYLMTMANTNFEEWRLANQASDIFAFDLSFQKMTLDGGLFDLEKVKSISKECLGRMSAEEISTKALGWAKEYHPAFASLIKKDFNYFKKILNIERGGDKPRKDYEKYADIYPIINFMFDECFYEEIKTSRPFNERFSKDEIVRVLRAYLADPGLDLSEEAWFAKLKATGEACGFAPRVKEYKQQPGRYLGHIGDFAEIIRIAVSARINTPNFYYVLKILGYDKIVDRINHTISLL